MQLAGRVAGIVITAAMLCSLPGGCSSSSGSGEGIGVTDVQFEADGVISGRVVVIDREGIRLADKSGVRVMVEDQDASTVSNSDGAWTLTGVAPGVLNLVWEKPGFGMSKRVALKFPGGQINNMKAWVVEQPKHYVEQFVDSIAGSDLYFVGTVGGDSSFATGGVRIFVGPGPGVSSLPGTYLATIKGSYLREQGDDEGGSLSKSTAYPGSFRIPLDSESRRGLGTGSVFYAVAFADAFLSLSYTDPLTGREVFTTLNPRPSAVIRIVIP